MADKIDEILTENISKYGIILLMVAGCCYTAYKIIELILNH